MGETGVSNEKAYFMQVVCPRIMMGLGIVLNKDIITYRTPVQLIKLRGNSQVDSLN